MTDISVYDAIPQTAPPAEAARPRLLLIATALACTGAAVGFGAMIGAYLSERAAVISEGETWLPRGVSIPLTQPNMMAATLTLSLGAIVWAVSAMRNDDRPNALTAIGLCIMFGFAFIAQTTYLFSIMELSLFAADGNGLDELARAPLFYGLVGAHVVMVGLAMGYLIVVAIRTLGGNYSARDLEGIYSAALFWIVTVVVYWAIWYAVYITK